MDLVSRLERENIPYHLVGTSALERFFRMPRGLVTTIETTAGAVDIARIYERVAFPGLPNWDFLIAGDTGYLLVREVDELAPAPMAGGRGTGGSAATERHPLLAFRYDPVRRSFPDPHELYSALSEARGRARAARGAWELAGEEPDPVEVDGLSAAEAALVSARFPIAPPPGATPPWSDDPGLPVEFHRLLLTRILDGRYAWRGLEVLMRSGYLELHLDQLAAMDRTDHSKEGHPEGNVWRHTLETLRYRKTTDLEVSLALLLHDAGKPISVSPGERRFDGHADTGARVARGVMRRLEFDEVTVENVAWLVRFHMIPGALERLPPHRRDPLMSNPLFAKLLEVYRCDLSSTYRGPENYYRACSVYRRFLKKSRSSVAGPPRRALEVFVE